MASPFRAALLAGLLAAGFGAAPVAAQPMERARAAQARGDLRAAQIEYRNAVRADPNSAAARIALATVSIDLGDGDTAEKEARAALDRGFDPAAGTSLLLRSLLLQNRARDLLRDFPVPEDPARAAVAGQIAAARALAQLSLNERDAARLSAEAAVRLAPNAVEPRLAAATVALVAGDRAASEAAVDQALVADPGSVEALLRKASLQFERGDLAAVTETTSRLLVRSPAHVPARILRAEAFLRGNDPAKAREEVDAALRIQPNSAPAAYLRGALLLQAQDWRGADATFQQLGPVLATFPDGYLLQAVAKRSLGQTAQALDAAQRHVARRPEDGRGVKLLATMELEANRPNEAVVVLNRYVGRGAPDVEALDMLGRAHAAAGRPRDAAEALQRATALAPQDAAILARLAAARLAAGDAAGTAQAAQGSLLLAPNQVGAREMLAVTALTRGDLAAAEAELGRLDATARRGEAARTLEGIIRLGKLDLAGARTIFETLLRDYPESIGARLGLVRVAAAQNRPAEVDRLLADVLRRDPVNGEAVGGVVAIATAGGARGAAAQGVLEAAQAAAPASPRPALALASVLAAAGQHDRASAVLDTAPLRAAGLGAALPLARAQAHAAASRWAEAETASRAALAEDPENAFARRQLAALLVRKGDGQAAEALVQEGLRLRPADPLLQQTLVGLVQQARGLDAALALADQMARQPATQPASRMLRGDLLLAAQRPAEAAQAHAAASAEVPSVLLTLRQAQAWRVASQPAQAEAALNAWLRREPESPEVLDVLAQLDIEAGRLAEAEPRLAMVVERTPGNAVALNNLAWVLGERGGPALARARELAERAYFLLPNVETADTLGWILARSGEPQLAVPLLRAAAAPRGSQPGNPAMTYRLAFALHAAGDRAEALRVLDPVVAGTTTFPERAAAERLLAELRAGR